MATEIVPKSAEQTIQMVTMKLFAYPIEGKQIVGGQINMVRYTKETAPPVGSLVFCVDEANSHHLCIVRTLNPKLMVFGAGMLITARIK